MKPNLVGLRQRRTQHITRLNALKTLGRAGMKNGTESYPAAFRTPCDWEMDGGDFRMTVSDIFPLQVSKYFLDPNFKLVDYFSSRIQENIYPPVHRHC